MDQVSQLIQRLVFAGPGVSEDEFLRIFQDYLERSECRPEPSSQTSEQ